jgi:hypothetical protein
MKQAGNAPQWRPSTLRRDISRIPAALIWLFGVYLFGYFSTGQTVQYVAITIIGVCFIAGCLRGILKPRKRYRR